MAEDKRTDGAHLLARAIVELGEVRQRLAASKACTLDQLRNATPAQRAVLSRVLSMEEELEALLEGAAGTVP